MKSLQSHIQATDPRLPLLRAIERELVERQGCLRIGQALLAALLPSRQHHGEQVARLQAETAHQLRELRRIGGELARLGVAFDAENPHASLALTRSKLPGQSTLDESGFHRRIGSSRN